VLHSSDEPGELAQWLCHGDSVGNIVVAIIMSMRLIGTVRAEPETVISRSWVQSPDPAK